MRAFYFIFLVLQMLKVGNGKEEDDEEYGGAEAKAGSAPTLGPIKRTREDDEEGNEDDDDEQDPKKLKV